MRKFFACFTLLSLFLIEAVCYKLKPGRDGVRQNPPVARSAPVTVTRPSDVGAAGSRAPARAGRGELSKQSPT